MFVCDDCGLIFPEPEVSEEPEQYEAWGYTFTQIHHYDVCPKCHSDRIREAPEEREDE